MNTRRKTQSENIIYTRMNGNRKSDYVEYSGGRNGTRKNDYVEYNTRRNSMDPIEGYIPVIPKVERQISSEYSTNNDGACMDTTQSGTIENLPSNLLNLDDHARKSKQGQVMSLWEKTQKLPPDYLKEVQEIYASTFPLEVRHYFAEWIESQPWSQIDENNRDHEGYAVQLLSTLIQQIEQKSQELPANADFFLLKLHFQNYIDSFREKYESYPLSFVKVMKKCLSLEEGLINKSENPSLAVEDNTAQQLALNKQITKDIETLQSLTLVTDADIKQLQDKQEAIIIQWKTTSQRATQLSTIIQQLQQKLEFTDTQINQLQQAGGDNQTELEILVKEKEDLTNKLREANAAKINEQSDLSNKAQEVIDLRRGLIEKYQSVCQGLDDVQKKVVDTELISWKRKQQLSGNGAPIDGGLLERIQSWCEGLAEVIWKNRQQILQFEVLRSRLPLNSGDNQPDILPELNQKITGLLSSLVTSTFIVEQQPPQVLKKESRFTAKIRLLVGGKLNIHMSPPTVKASIISEDQARGLLKSDTKVKEADSGDILNKEGTMEYHDAKGELSIQFRNMQLKKIKRADKKGSEAVTEEKFCILFQSDFQLGNGELMFQVWTLSLPVVVTVHGNQECNALATVLWDNQFAEPGRTPFQVPSQVPWSHMAQLLNTKFAATTGRGLSTDNLNYLASKVFGGKPVDDYSNHSINWALFNKDPLQGRSFTFWEWFYAIMRLTKDHLKNLWADGTIIGFISKTLSQDWLMTKPVGTFLCRFSDSELGGVTIAWSAEDPNKPGERQVWNLAPYQTKEINIRTLADRIKDLPQLTHLYPDIPKHQAFSQYYSSDTLKLPKNGEYVPSFLTTVVDINPGGAPMSYDNPQTPQAQSSFNPDSPAPGSMYSTQASTPGPASVSSTNNALMDQFSTIAEANEEDMLDAVVSCLDYGADDMNLMDILQNNM